MRLTLFTLVLLVGSSAASAEVWRIREGTCGDWRTRWNLEQERDGLWVGQAEHVHVGGPCAPERGHTDQSEIRATIAGEDLFATRRMSNGGYAVTTVGFGRTASEAMCSARATRPGTCSRYAFRQAIERLAAMMSNVMTSGWMTRRRSTAIRHRQASTSNFAGGDRRAR